MLAALIFRILIEVPIVQRLLVVFFKNEPEILTFAKSIFKSVDKFKQSSVYKYYKTYEKLRAKYYVPILQFYNRFNIFNLAQNYLKTKIDAKHHWIFSHSPFKSWLRHQSWWDGRSFKTLFKQYARGTTNVRTNKNPRWNTYTQNWRGLPTEYIGQEFEGPDQYKRGFRQRLSPSEQVQDLKDRRFPYPNTWYELAGKALEKGAFYTLSLVNDKRIQKLTATYYGYAILKFANYPRTYHYYYIKWGLFKKMVRVPLGSREGAWSVYLQSRFGPKHDEHKWLTPTQIARDYGRLKSNLNKEYTNVFHSPVNPLLKIRGVEQVWTWSDTQGKWSTRWIRLFPTPTQGFKTNTYIINGKEVRVRSSYDRYYTAYKKYKTYYPYRKYGPTRIGQAIIPSPYRRFTNRKILPYKKVK